MISKPSYPNYSIQEYLKNKPFFFAFLRPLEIELFRRYLPFKKPVLDFGCGDGFFAKVAFADQDKIEVGIDVNPRVKRQAEESGTYHKVVIYDGRKLPFPDHSFTTVISNCVLEHVVDLPFALKEIHRVLKPGGIFISSVVTDKWDNNLVGGKVFGSIYRNWFRKIQRHENMHTETTWKDSFNKAGFEVNKVIPYLTKKQGHWVELMHYPSIFPFLGKTIARNILFTSTRFTPSKEATDNNFAFYSLTKI